jgi:hypothetical protein
LGGSWMEFVGGKADDTPCLSSSTRRKKHTTPHPARPRRPQTHSSRFLWKAVGRYGKKTEMGRMPSSRSWRRSATCWGAGSVLFVGGVKFSTMGAVARRCSRLLLCPQPTSLNPVQTQPKHQTQTQPTPGSYLVEELLPDLAPQQRARRRERHQRGELLLQVDDALVAPAGKVGLRGWVGGVGWAVRGWGW